jgi:hypothetical protein
VAGSGEAGSTWPRFMTLLTFSVQQTPEIEEDFRSIPASGAEIAPL